MGLRSSLTGLPREIWLLYAATLISRAGTMSLLFLTVYLSSLGIGKAHAGLAVSVYGLGALVSAPVAGYLCDRTNPLIVMKAALLLQGCVLMLLTLGGELWSLIVTILAWALVGEAFRPASSAFISSLTGEGQRRFAFAVNSVAVNLGMTIGPALGGLLIRTKPSSIFIANGAASIAAGVFLVGSLWGRSFDELAGEGDARSPRRGGDELGVRDLLLFLLALLPAFAVFFQYRSAMPQHFVTGGILEPQAFGRLMLINALLMIVLQVPVIACLRRLREKTSMALGAFLLGAGFGCFAFAATFAAAAACVLVWTLGQMALLSASDTYVSKVAGGKKGLYMGLYHAAMNLAAFVGPVLGSVALQHSSLLLWGATFVWGCFSAVLLLHLTRQR